MQRQNNVSSRTKLLLSQSKEQEDIRFVARLNPAATGSLLKNNFPATSRNDRFDQL
jgi:hypothetical protein